MAKDPKPSDQPATPQADKTVDERMAELSARIDESINETRTLLGEARSMLQRVDAAVLSGEKLQKLTDDVALLSKGYTELSNRTSAPPVATPGRAPGRAGAAGSADMEQVEQRLSAVEAKLRHM